jgi:hypothetical protein
MVFVFVFLLAATLNPKQSCSPSTRGGDAWSGSVAHVAMRPIWVKDGEGKRKAACVQCWIISLCKIEKKCAVYRYLRRIPGVMFPAICCRVISSSER